MSRRLFGLVAVTIVLAPFLLAPPATADTPSEAAPRKTRTSAYATLLSRYVVRLPSRAAYETRFDYLALHAAPKRDSLLAAARAELFDGVTPWKWSHDRRVAWAINAYNFLVLETVTRHLFVTEEDAAARKPVGSVLDIRIEGGDVFKAPLVEVDGRTYSLDTFERRFVFDGFDHRKGGKPPKTLDPRAHFALVCAARGCPPLVDRPYTATQLDSELDEAARRALASPRHLIWTGETGQLEASSIFDWYAADFGGPGGVMAFIQDHAPQPVRKEIERGSVREVSSFIAWDWGLNQTP